MKKFAVKLRCCNNAVIQMLFDILGAIKVKNIFGYELFLVTYLRVSNQFDSMGFTLSQVYFLVLDAFYWGVFCKTSCCCCYYYYYYYLQIVMEYCGGGSVSDLMNVTEEPLEEYQIAYICREALKVSLILIGWDL